MRNNVQYIRRDDLSIFHEGEYESLFVEIKDAQKNLIIGEIYRVPGTNEQQSLERYEESISRILAEGNKNTILATDQNFNFLNINEHKHTSDLLELYLSNGLIPAITRPTRITHTSQTLIDNIYINNEQNCNISSEIQTTKLSDHLPIFTFVGSQCKSAKAKHIKITRRKFKEEQM